MTRSDSPCHFDTLMLHFSSSGTLLTMYVLPSRKLIAYTNPDSTDAPYVGYVYAFLLYATAFVQSMVAHQYFHRTFVIGMRIRTAIVSAVYKKVGASLLYSHPCL